MRNALMTLCFALSVNQVAAADGDFRTGNFGETWCGAPATFEVHRQVEGTWVFEGRIAIRDTGEYDRLKIEQYEDQSLRITRYLSGELTGKRQTVSTPPPKYRTSEMYFRTSNGKGVGCNNGALTMLRVPY